MAAKGKENRIVITLACTECKSRNYVTTKNKKNDPDRMVQRKYCVALPSPSTGTSGNKRETF